MGIRTTGLKQRRLYPAKKTHPSRLLLTTRASDAQNVQHFAPWTVISGRLGTVFSFWAAQCQQNCQQTVMKKSARVMAEFA